MSVWPLKLGLALRGRRLVEPALAAGADPGSARIVATPEDLVLGDAVNEGRIAPRLTASEVVGKHLHCVGATGAGKTAWAIAFLEQLLDRDFGLAIVDAKGDIFSLAVDMLCYRLATVPDIEAALSRIRVVDPFSTTNLVAWNLCARDPSVPVDLQAHELGSLALQSVQADTGIRQGRLLHSLLALVIDTGGTLLDAHRALVDPVLLASLVLRTGDERLHHYFRVEFPKEPKVTVSGVVARLDALLRLPSWRQMFDCDEGLDFERLLSPGVTLINIGNAPLGCRDLQSFAGRLLFLRLARAVMNRPVMSDDLPPVAIAIDEVQEFISAEVAGEMSRLVALARSRKTSLFLFHQQSAQLDGLSSGLAKILATNAAIRLLFRSSLEDARLFAHALPVTGCVLRGDYRPDQGSTTRSPYLTPSEERQMLLERIPRLPSRQFYYWYAEGKRARLLRSRDVPLRTWRAFADAHPELRERVLRGCLPLARPRSRSPFSETTARKPVTVANEMPFSSIASPVAETRPADLEEFG